MRINNNISAMNTHRYLGVNSLNAAKSMEKLSSGLRINRAADDAAGLSISEKMRGQIRGLAQAQRNAQDGISLIQTAEGALDEVSAMLVRMKELTVQMANGTYNTEDTDNIELEINQLGKEIDSIILNTKFNGTAIFDAAASFEIVVSDDGVTGITIDAADLAAAGGLESDIGNATPVVLTVTDIEAAITAVNTQRATYGSQQNRLESTVRNLGATVENLQAADPASGT
jgi:flagellin